MPNRAASFSGVVRVLDGFPVWILLIQLEYACGTDRIGITVANVPGIFSDFSCSVSYFLI